eukprot:CAMPEP_0176167418 /NCGR_PEP_ID=MMETSP0120_2-20121206/85656_1 /TAXON_ID=160619 /ORGANISM="Kryptoperidinium foliaceum, Strain CCMP 1326" /LENGTH=91 /DNA_ID=CAMNT_0017505045 /DNA_START=79 /DNA_END=351 /DNA_ORIENTATION=+
MNTPSEESGLEHIRDIGAGGDDGGTAATDLDPREVFNASLEFEHRNSNSLSRMSAGSRNSSNSERLYPSLESLDKALSDNLEWKGSSEESS